MRVLIAGGGTGGHLFPGIAIAEALRGEDSLNAILFVGTDNPLETSIVTKKGFDHAWISAEGIKGKGVFGKIRSLFKLPRALWQSVKVIGSFSPDLVIGVGGFSSGPLAVGAKLMGKKVAIHEQNSIPGLTNRWLGRLVDRVFISFPDRLEVFGPDKTVVTGNPVRRELLSVAKKPKGGEPFTIAVLGGSQGAHSVNKAVTQALVYLKEAMDVSKIEFVHQTGVKDASWVAAAYKAAGVRATVAAFFEDMAQVYGAADVVICRAGATTVAELAAVGKPALYIPYPYAANNHQEFNARYVADAGGGEVILDRDLKPSLLASKIVFYCTKHELLQNMAACAAAIGMPNATQNIVDECRKLVVA